MSIIVECPVCHWQEEYPDKTKVNDLLDDCPVCHAPTTMYAVADWLRGMSPD